MIEDELQKLNSLEKNSAEFNTTRNYLDWLTQMPWGVTTEETFDLTKAQEILDADHAGRDTNYSDTTNNCHQFENGLGLLTKQ